MCAKCDLTVEMLEQTRGINSGDFTVVEFSFPNGTPRLRRMVNDDSNNSTGNNSPDNVAGSSAVG